MVGHGERRGLVARPVAAHVVGHRPVPAGRKMVLCPRMRDRGAWPICHLSGPDSPYIVYISESGTFVGADPTGFLPSRGYDELNAMLEVD